MTARGDAALTAAIVATKAATIACAIDGFVNADTPRLRGKAIRTRAVGYTAGLFLVPVIWRLLPDRGRYPRGLEGPVEPRGRPEGQSPPFGRGVTVRTAYGVVRSGGVDGHSGGVPDPSSPR